MAPREMAVEQETPTSKPDTSVAPTAAQDPSGSPTPEWIVKVSKYIAWHNFLVPTIHGFILPFFVLAWQIQNNYWLTWKEFGILCCFGYPKLMVVFVILHRFFAHKSFSASRPVAFVLGLIALTGGQKGPLWWGSKHVRHHKFCENEGDPHCAKLYGMPYAYVGWLLHPCEWYIDWDFVHAPFKTWELVLCESLTGVVPFGEMYLCYKYLGFKPALMLYWATISGIYLTLLFNVALHHDESVDSRPMSNGKFRCRAHNKLPLSWRLILDLIGEMDHLDHHHYPRRALHPCTSIDVPYWFFIWPGEKLGLFYDVNHNGRKVFTKRRE